MDRIRPSDFHGPPEDLQVSTPDVQEVEIVVRAPFGEEPKISGVAHERVAGVLGEEPAIGARSVKLSGSSTRTSSAAMTVAAPVASLMTHALWGRDQGIDQIHTRT